MSSQDFAQQTREYAARVETALTRLLPDPADPPQRLHTAMRYACLGGGKRLRAMLVYATGEALGAELSTLDVPASAVELVHAYSLVHDDLPAMDDDDLRRGQPTCHVAFDEATAILAGDALQTLAFQVLAREPMPAVDPPTRIELLATLAQATGSEGMAGGQSLDLEAVGQELTPAALDELHRLKTGALIRAAVALGALCSPNTTPKIRKSLDDFAAHIGLAFQITDDILDDHGDPALLGKTPGSDRRQDKPTYTSLLGLAESRRQAEKLHQQALASLQTLGDNAKTLGHLAEIFINRSF